MTYEPMDPAIFKMFNQTTYDYKKVLRDAICNIERNDRVHYRSEIFPLPVDTIKELDKTIKEQDKEIRRLTDHINGMVEYKDEKQKVLKITAPDVLKKNIKADVVIVYGNVSGKIDAKNVVCVKDLTEKSDIKNKIVVPSEIEIEKLNYYKEHPDCYCCKFCKKGRDSCYSTTYFCKISDKNVREYHKIRARLCKQYNPKENL